MAFNLGSPGFPHRNQPDRLAEDRYQGAEKDVLAGIAVQGWPKIRQLMVEVRLGADERDVIKRQLKGCGFQTSIGKHPLPQGGVPIYCIYAKRCAATAARPA